MLSKITKIIAVFGSAAVLAVGVNAFFDDDYWDDDYYWNDNDTEYWDEHISGGFSYIVNSHGTVTVTGCEDRETVKLEIPSELDGKAVTHIYSEAFHWLMELKSVTVPDSVVWMGSSVFSGCKKLEEVTLSKNIREIPYNCFYGCESLKKLEIPEGVTSIGSGAFGGCFALEEVRIPASVNDIAYGTFVGCEKLTVYCRRGSEAARYCENLGDRHHINCVLEAPPAGETAMVLGIVAAAWGVVILAIIIGVAVAGKREKKGNEQSGG